MYWYCIILIIIGFFTGCATPEKVAPPVAYTVSKPAPNLFIPQRTKIAVILPFVTNPLSYALLDAINLAVLNSPLASKVELVVINSDNTPANIIAKRLAIEQVKLVLGPLLTSEIHNLMPYLDQLSVKFFAFSNNADLYHPNLYLLGINPKEQIKRLVNYAVKEGYKELFLLLPADQPGKAYAEVFRKSLKDKESYIAAIEFYLPKSQNILLAVQAIQSKLQISSQKKIVFLAETGDNAKIILDYFEQAQINKMPNLEFMTFREIQRLEGLPVMNLPAIKIVEGSIEQKETFIYNFSNTFGYMPHFLVSIAYDAASIALRLIELNQFSAQALENINGFSGIDGVFRFNTGKSSVKRYFNVVRYGM